MIVNPIKRKFLILGLTGPLRSGCTTAAEFFSDNPREIVNEYCSRSDQSLIESTYNEISMLLKEESPSAAILSEKKDYLKELLKTRELKKLLSKVDMPTFYYISMSNMLLKYVVEFLIFGAVGEIDPKYAQFVSIINQENFSKDLIEKINDVIDDKKYRDLSNEDCADYEQYLNRLEVLMNKLKADIEHECLGNILQDLGDNIRKHGNPFHAAGDIVRDRVYLLSEQANKVIKFFRNRTDKTNRRHHFVIECFRNPYEVEYFRYRYYEFYLISLFAEEKVRQSRGSFSNKRDERDRGDNNKLEEIFKQNVAQCVFLSDIAVNNETAPEEFYEKLLIYYALILSPGCITPTTMEVFMNQAYSLSLKSSCISHQVGAVIIGENGYVVGAGWNDVGDGQIGCGYRQFIDIQNLHNDILPIDPSEELEFRNKLLQSNHRGDESFCYKDEYSAYKVGGLAGLPKDIRIKRLEYCRALHAEENALLQSAKIGGMGVKGGTIYTTFFPCELCAKKIYQTGIKEVIYTEPYPEKSISCNIFLKDGIKKIKLTQFEGVKSHSYFRLYKANIDKKEAQRLERLDLSNKQT